MDSALSGLIVNTQPLSFLRGRQSIWYYLPSFPVVVIWPQLNFWELEVSFQGWVFQSNPIRSVIGLASIKTSLFFFDCNYGVIVKIGLYGGKTLVFGSRDKTLLFWQKNRREMNNNQGASWDGQWQKLMRCLKKQKGILKIIFKIPLLLLFFSTMPYSQNAPYTNPARIGT